MKQDPLILGIESSCDETAAAVIRGRELLSDEIASSAATQAKYGGVVPEIASRAHAEAVDEVVARALKAANVQKQQLDAVAVTYGAGLLGALLVGLSFAKGFAYGLNIPLIGVDHIRGHLAAAYLEDTTLEPPFITLLASGGHTAILYAERADKFRVLGGTLDDAEGRHSIKLRAFWGFLTPAARTLKRSRGKAVPSSRCPRCSRAWADMIFPTAA